ncbi:MAG: aminotransferase class I/II-fold pyridoxal phosphate-dependent enzyme [Roseitalea sp.]|nr:aminotransferase class I/II-fold pyridoxal phosphate-dependent enzyme [Roseitalea sp.]MBO6953831.1 aminotransferase class I/II-fold pyridoxal phosphate-dependent enzyme [Rhizobiaceae bacterium]MBO6594148.1 aminotransferase class I/II-fold pyridoxal phosphate-dependent enzyme [Roseitalea sp.]MBO6601538.1 aminotransferase class I/II-fold pyridoxal phosphate-dependent enzyme [Roseitalea sp.]MBO6613999.1 aminotransferase class I/II-fold pyridoxal phosphate-dependent enzyme [Roseitalea sp.]
MDYDGFFIGALTALRDDGDYRVFADRWRGALPNETSRKGRASARLCDFVRSFASGFIFTTALPPALAAGAAAAARRLEISHTERCAHRQVAAKVRRRLDAEGVRHMTDDSRIAPWWSATWSSASQSPTSCSKRYPIAGANARWPGARWLRD